MSRHLFACLALVATCSALGSCQTVSVRNTPAVRSVSRASFVPQEELELRVVSMEVRAPELGELISGPEHYRPPSPRFEVPCRGECALLADGDDELCEGPSPFVPTWTDAPRGSFTNDFYLTLGTGIADPEKDSSWTSAAIYPVDTSAPTLPAMQIFGQTAREMELFQVAPGIFWWPTEQLQVTLSVPFGMSGRAPEVGVLLALTY